MRVVIAAVFCCLLIACVKKDQASAFSVPSPEIPAAVCPALDESLAAELLRLPVKCLDVEYPNKQCYFIEKEEDLKPSRLLNPAFYGCFDWHSSVHGHWSMVRLLKLFPKIALADEARSRLAAHFTKENMTAELAYFQSKVGSSFERTYGWAWYLRLYTELLTWNDPDAVAWREALRPLAEHFAAKTADYLTRLSYPVRTGIHGNLAFSLVHMLDYARVAGDRKLEEAIIKRALDFYGKDIDCPAAYEPSGVDFISPCLAEADLMRRVYDREHFAKWLDAFLPPVGTPAFTNLRTPPMVLDVKDYAIGHLIGLDMHRAAAYRGMVSSLPDKDNRRESFKKLADLHCAEGLRLMNTAGYGGEHWLGTFAIYMLMQ